MAFNTISLIKQCEIYHLEIHNLARQICNHRMIDTEKL